ncbi:MAG: hypothetical protein HKN22_04095, partial [Bacteroidia bacterium]|nr:hypothetical protein [Bacteroidia bacterium]
MAFALVLAITGKNRPTSKTKYLIAFHFSLLLVYILFLIGISSGQLSDEYKGLIFLIFFCSGIITFGWILRTEVNIILKIYFGLFVASAAGFLFSPSSTLYFIGSGNFQKPFMQEYPITDNLYLHEQQSMIKSSAKYPLYKVVRKTGSFNKALSRDLDFEGTVDSIWLIS